MALQPVGNPFETPAPAQAQAPAPAFGNPFSGQAPATSSATVTSGGNPFDPFSSPAADPHSPGPGSQQQPSTNPFGPPQPPPLTLSSTYPLPQQSLQLQDPSQIVPVSLLAQQQSVSHCQVQSVQPTPHYSQQIPNLANSSALISHQQPSNPYSGLVSPQKQGNPFEQAIVQVTPVVVGANQWADPPLKPALFEPYAPTQTQTPTTAPPPQSEWILTQQYPPQQQATQSDPNMTMVLPHQQYTQQHDPNMTMLVPHQYPAQQYTSEPDPMAFDEPPMQHNAMVPYNEQQQNREIVPYDEQPETQAMVPFKPQGEFGTDIVPGGLAEPPVGSPVNKYSQVLAMNAPSEAAPLPKGDLVLKSGFVLARISFRTIVMKKWKQAFWVMYGPHTMLWFRSHADFDDWLNNPYLTQTQCNYLIKLAVNFVHDLYRPNVRGYQVTQARSKPYGNKIYRQFKLERWMDYGPTIAAAFASLEINEIDSLRQAIVECMRNTPVGDGIRATGAVRQDGHENQGDNSDDGNSDQRSPYHNEPSHDKQEDTRQALPVSNRGKWN